MKVFGFRCGIDIDEISDTLRRMGVDAILMDSSMVIGTDHITSAMMHAERSFENGTNRSKTLITEFLMYMAGERQISKALEAMRPKSNDVVIVLLKGDISAFDGIDMERDDFLIAATDEKAKTKGFVNSWNIPAEDLILEDVAMLDTMKT